MKALSETSIYRYANSVGGRNIPTLIQNCIDTNKGAIYLDESQMEDVFYKIRHKSFNFSAKFAVLSLFSKGVIKLVYNSSNNLTVALPFVKIKLPNGGFGIVVNITNYAKIDSEGRVSMDENILYSMMLTGAFSLISDRMTTLLSSYGLVSFYADLMVNVLSRTMMLDQIKRDTYKFIFAKFMYIQLGMDDARSSAGAKSLIKMLDQSQIDAIDLANPISVYDDLEILINHLREKYSDFKDVTLAAVFSKWMSVYGEATGFAIEDINSLVYMFDSLIINANRIVNIKGVEKTVNRHANKLIMLFNRIENSVMEIK